MHSIYELTTLSCPLLSVPEASARARAFIGEDGAAGELLGCWQTEIGQLGRLLLLRGFETAEELGTERRRALLSVDPFYGAGVVTALSMESFAPFPFLPPVHTKPMGGIYEFRTYLLKPGGLPPTLAGWEKAIKPAFEYTSHLVTTMYALDGPPRITHIWGFESLEQRATLRARFYAAGLWPPQGGPEQIAEATSTIALSEDSSPLR
jgi:NIPSNAP